jgi:hypothetical protein
LQFLSTVPSSKEPPAQAIVFIEGFRKPVNKRAGTNMRQHSYIRRLGACVGATLVAAFFVTAAPVVPGAVAPAQAQAVVAEFHEALAPYGRWESASRWGEVWIPNQVDRDWRPYTVGHWVYTDDWGWYWAADTAEEDWGWIVYHYGRWLYSRDVGWFWIPGNEWSPAWVNWRRGTEYVGWAPLPPDDVIVEYRDAPEFWVFCRPRDFLSERIVNVIVPFRDYDRIVRDTVVVNRTVVLNERHFAVNPGIEPTVIAAAVGRPLRAFSVQPRILAGTARIEGAREIRAGELRERRGDFRTTFRETNTTIRAKDRVAPPQPLAARERGRFFGEHTPRAAEGSSVVRELQRTGQERQAPGGEQQRPGTQGRAVTQEEQRRQQGQQRRPGTEGRGATPEQQRQGTQRKGAQPKGAPKGAQMPLTTPEQRRGMTTEQQRSQQQRPGAQLPQGTQGRGNVPTQEERRGQQPKGPQAARERRSEPGLTRGEPKSSTTEGRSRGTEPKGAEPKTPATQGRGGLEQRQGRGIEQRPSTESRGAQPRAQTRPEPRTEGRGGGAPQVQRSAPQRSMPEPRTEGRGGGGGTGPAAQPRGAQGQGGGPGRRPQ